MTGKKREPILVERHPYDALTLYEITGDELDRLEAEGLSVGEDFSFGLFGLSVAASFTIALLTTKIEGDRVFYSFLIVTIIGYVMSAFFGIRWLWGRRRHKSTVRRIRGRVGPLGDETKEVGPRELANLPSDAMPPQGSS